MRRLRTFTECNIERQGFEYLDEEAIGHYVWPLRFTPAVAAVLILIGLTLQSPSWLSAIALVALSGALMPGGMFLDLIYNLAVRHLFGGWALPDTPKPRRFSYFLSTILLAGSAASFYFGQPVVGFILGGAALIGATILTATLWCLGSWIYRLVARGVVT